ncbi:MAG: AAA family ATPase [Alteromonadaceae bacterium]|nr:AAA family ATPase [Alteromonadaceae bacterium]
MLYIFGGLPAAGKSELARFLATSVHAVYLRIDTIEQTLKEHGFNDLYDQGYQAGFSIALDNLKNGLSVVADSTNPVAQSRLAWIKTAKQANMPYTEIEVHCSNPREHQQRVETRVADIQGLILPDWQSVISRQYQPWLTPQIVIDTAGKTPSESKTELMANLSRLKNQ